MYELNQADQIRNEVRRLVNGLTAATQAISNPLTRDKVETDRIITAQFATACRLEELIFGGPNNPPIEFKAEGK